MFDSLIEKIFELYEKLLFKIVKKVLPIEILAK